MPRVRRIVIPNHPHHVLQRGRAGQRVFATDRDYRFYLGTLAESKDAFGIRIYAYCLMPGEVRLLLEPQESAELLGRFMKHTAARMTRYRNRLDDRSGTLWESRYRSSPVERETYLLRCARYIELHPVQARATRAPEDHPWSSYRMRAGLADWEWLDEDLAYHALGTTPEQRARAYRRFIREPVPDGEWRFMAEALQRGQLTGNERYVDQVERITGRRIEYRGRGRPPKHRRPVMGPLSRPVATGERMGRSASGQHSGSG